MALRKLPNSEDRTTAKGPSEVVGLPTFWEAAEVAPKTGWEEWWDHFKIAANKKHLISVDEIIANVTEQNPRIPAFINNLNEQSTEKKLVSLFCLSLGTVGRKSVT